jgi:spore coat polysaccharide biosynthesis protein SpsF
MIGCIIQARMNSSRLPKKVLMNITKNETILDFVINQLKSSKNLDEIIIATTNLPIDNQIVEFAKKKQIKFFRGPEKDVLARYYDCAKSFSLDTIVRITSDCPLTDPIILDYLIEQFIDGNYDFISPGFPRTFPQGSADIEVFSFQSLEKMSHEAIKPSEREHVCTYIYNNPEKFHIHTIPNPLNFSNLKWSIDRKNDLKFVQEIVKRISKRPIITNDILNLLKNEPELIQINKNSILEEGYKKSIQEDQKLGFSKNSNTKNYKILK